MKNAKNISAMNKLSMTADHYEHTILFENHHLMNVLVRLSHLQATSEGIYAGVKQIPWRDALPKSLGIPTLDATITDGERWLNCVSESWAALYNAKAQGALAKKIADDSTIENDNLYLLTMFNALRSLVDNIFPFVDIPNYKEFEPEGAKAMKDIVNGLIGVTDGVLSTKKVKDDIFEAGVESAIMALNTQKHLLSTQGKDVSGILQAIDIIKASQRDDSQSISTGQRVN